MLDSGLAELYQVPGKSLNPAVRRNANRFPADLMFQLTKEEFENLRFQIATSSSGYGGRRYLPYAFSEHGVAILSAVLNSERAVQMSILIVRAFVKLRELPAANTELARKIEQIEATQKKHARALQEHSSILVSVVQDIQKPKSPPITRAIGFVPRSPRKKKSTWAGQPQAPRRCHFRKMISFRLASRLV